MVFITGVQIFLHICFNYMNAVQCQSNGDLRLVGGESEIEGRVEVYYEGSWGTICDDLWDDVDATIVCRQLELSENGAASFQAAFGRGSGTIYLEDVQCRGSEQTLLECNHPDWGLHNCDHTEDAGVYCINDGEIRLSEGQRKGRVEVFHGGQWGTVCDDGWDEADTVVVCRQLGLNGSFFATSSREIGFGSGVIWLTNVECSGTEPSLKECRHQGWGVHSCNHQEDVGIYCDYGGLNNEIRLRNGQSPNEGRVEIFHDGQWGTVCDDGWDNSDAEVVCRQLGYNGPALSSPTFGPGSGPIWLDNVECSGPEGKLHECSSAGWGIHNCGHSEDAGVRCVAIENDIRIIGPSQGEGRIEIFHDGQWGTVCDDLWDDTDAEVVCRQLGFNGSVIPLHYAHFGQGSDPIWLDNVECNGTEEMLYECASNGWGSHNCGHSEDAGVRCSDNDMKIDDYQGTPPEIRLVGGSSPNEGRVEVYKNGIWGTVCDDGWDDKDAVVVCRQIGFNTGGTAIHQAAFGKGSGSILLDDVNCSGDEENITICRSSAEGDCSHDEDAGVRCNDVRLTYGQKMYEGRVEVYSNGQWGTVCDGSWNNIDAQVVCHQLGFGSSGTAVLHSFFGSSTRMRLHDVDCTGSETSLLNCENAGWTEEKCSTEDVGVTCHEDTLSCLNSPCLNGGTCITRHTNRDVCLCLDDFYGNFCEIGKHSIVTKRMRGFPIFISIVCVLLVGVIICIAFWIRRLKLSQDTQALNYFAMRKQLIEAIKSFKSSSNEYKGRETCRKPVEDDEDFYLNEELYDDIS